MAQHDYVISDQDGASFLADLNNLSLAIASQNSGASAPVVTYAYQLWADTAANKLKMRNSVNSAWVILGDLDQEAMGLLSLGSLRAQAGLAYLSTGVAPAYAVDASPDYPALTDNLMLNVRFHAANANVACTLALDGGAPISIKQQDEDGNYIDPIFPANFRAQLIYASSISAWVIVNPFQPRLGINQVRTNFTGSRSFGVTYTNTTKKPIIVTIRALVAVGAEMTFQVGGVIFDSRANSTGSTTTFMVSGIVQPGEQYLVSQGSGATIITWYEVR